MLIYKKHVQSLNKSKFNLFVNQSLIKTIIIIIKDIYLVKYYINNKIKKLVKYNIYLLFIKSIYFIIIDLYKKML